MGQQADSGRNASLDDKKERAAGRQTEQPVEAGSERDDFGNLRPAQGTAGGAFGAEEGGHTKPRGETERSGSNLSQGGGGGGAGAGMASGKTQEPKFDVNSPEPDPK